MWILTLPYPIFLCQATISSVLYPLFLVPICETVNTKCPLNCLVKFCISLFHMKITASVTKSSHQDRGPCYLHLPFFSYTCTYLFWKIRSYRDLCFPQQVRSQTTVHLCILQGYCSVRIDFNIDYKRHTLPIVNTMLV